MHLSKLENCQTGSFLWFCLNNSVSETLVIGIQACWIAPKLLNGHVFATTHFFFPSTKTFNMLVYTYEQPSSFPVTLCLSEESVTVSIRDTLNLFKWTEIADLHVAPCLKCVYIFWVKHQLVTEISQVAGEMVICLDAPVCLQSQPAPPSLLVGDDVYKHMLNLPLRYSARLKLIWVC